jgi:pimeloyl-ACP methyl ester carboxylesterase
VTSGPADAVLVFHGTPGSRLDARFWSAAAKQLGGLEREFIGFDRPGYGLAAPEPGRTLLSVAESAATLVPAGDVRLLAVSGGGPFALATASVLDDRVRSLTIVSGFGPPEFGLGPLTPVASADREAVTAWARDVIASNPPFEPSGIELLDLFAASNLEGIRSSDGIVDDVLALREPWPEQLLHVTVPTTFFHAVDDDRCPLAAARFLAESLANGRIVEWPDGGHLAMAHHLADVIDAL